MPTDPYVAPDLQDEPRNEPTLAPGLRVPPSRRWRSDRPGDLADGVQPSGPLFGAPGPNNGYGTTLTHRAARGFALAAHEDRHDAEAVVAALAMRRAASYGRGPVIGDVEYAATLLGYLGGAPAAFVAWRADAVEGAHHDAHVVQRVCAVVGRDDLRGPAGRAGELAGVVQERALTS